MSGKRNKKGGTASVHLKFNKRNPEITISEVPIETIPTTIGQDKLNILTAGDANPYFFAQAIQFPIDGNGDIYGDEFFNSFVARNKEHAFPGSKYGHSTSWNERQPSHFFQVGSMIVGNNVYFKFYVPSTTDAESNESFIKEIKANGIDLSLVSKVKYAYNEDTQEFLMLESVGGERNDAVGYGDGSMDQTVYNKENENIEEGLEVTKEELLIKLNALMVNGDVTVVEIMKVLNKSDLIKSEKDIADLKVLNSLSAVLGDKPLEKLTEITDSVKLNAEAVRNSELLTAFGDVKNADGTDNMVRIQGELLLGDKVANKENVEAVKANATFIAVCGNLADENSGLNRINKNDADTPTGGIKHVKA